MNQHQRDAAPLRGDSLQITEERPELRGASEKLLLAESAAHVIGEEEVRRFSETLRKYHAGKLATERRIVASEEWWKLRNASEGEAASEASSSDFKSRSGWLHNVIVSKHADAMEAYPEPNILPREEADKDEAQALSAIIPCVLAQNNFEDTFADVSWQRLKTGTGVYKVFWDKDKLGGLGDIGIERINLLNVYWEPGVTDIQRSRYFFHTELYDKEVLEEIYPDLLSDKQLGSSFVSTKFLYDDHVDTENKATVIDVYYHKNIDGKRTLQYVKYVGETVLFATENDPEYRKTGLYDHCKYPYVFVPLFPIEGSPCGYGFVDLCRNPQTEIDLLKTSFVKNARIGSQQRYFSRLEGSINEEEFLDLSKPIVHVSGGTVDDTSIRPIDYNSLDSTYISVLDRAIQELRETSGNTETATGSGTNGATAASAIAALQEASGKGSKDSTRTHYRKYAEVIELCIELIRQFYNVERKFRILGESGVERFIGYSNRNLKAKHQGTDYGRDMGYRLPVFDIKVSAQKQSLYTKVSQNELALQFFGLGFFNPQMTDQALMCLDAMDFDGKDAIRRKVAQNGTMAEKLTKYMQLSLVLAQTVRPDLVSQISADLMQTAGGAAAGIGRIGAVSAPSEVDHISGLGGTEPTIVKNARARAQDASQPDGGAVIKER